jgi:O-antigen ligase
MTTSERSPGLLANLSWFLPLALAFTIPFPIRINSAVLIACLVVNILWLLTSGNGDRKVLLSYVFLNSGLLFLILAVGVAWGGDVRQASMDLERNTPILLLPLMIYQWKNRGISGSWLLTAMALGCLAIISWGFLNALIILDHDQFMDMLRQGHLLFTGRIFMHPTYLSIYLIVTFYFLLERLRTGKVQKKGRVSVVVALVAIVVILGFIRSQSALSTFVILSVMYLVIVFKKRAWAVTFALFSIGFVVYSFDNSRVSTVIDRYGKNVSTALDQRFSVWRGAFEAIRHRPVFGAGTGGEQHVLDAEYRAMGFQEGIDNSYNAHDQYLQFMIRNGLPELVSFLALFVYSFRRSVRQSDYTFLMFNMAVALVMITESFLNVQKGIMFFYFFLSVFIFLPLDRPRDLISQDNP